MTTTATSADRQHHVQKARRTREGVPVDPKLGEIESWVVMQAVAGGPRRCQSQVDAAGLIGAAGCRASTRRLTVCHDVT
jgi:hypothetical protein